ncbi:MAG: ceramidase domain-containing protein [Elusimicrobiota bacterium]|nr:ceramidase domain-containing protein [Elusimicrobiota bacterium]
MTGKRSAAVLLSVAAAAVAALFLQAPIPQDPAYHVFADARALAGIPNFADVLSNLPFLIVGLYGLTRRPAAPRLKTGYLVLCAGVALVSLGSAYYHLNPTSTTLLWDRLPMTVAFMALFSLLLEDRVTDAKTLVPLVAIGLASAFYWHYTDDLRPYILVQFLPIVLMPLILLFYPKINLDGKALMSGVALYCAAKALEYCDRPVLEALGALSGHSLKHITAAAASLCVIRAVPAGRQV